MARNRASNRSAHGSDMEATPGNLPKLHVMPDALAQPLLNSLPVMSLELRASLVAALGRTAEAKSLFVKASQGEKALGYREPPNYIRARRGRTPTRFSRK